MIVEELNNKHTLVGVFSGDIIFDRLPARFPLAVYLEFLPPSDGDHKLELAFRVGGKPMAGMLVEIKGAQRGMPLAISAPQMHLNITKNVTLSITARLNDGPITGILKKRLFKGHIPNPSPFSIASPPPS